MNRQAHTPPTAEYRCPGDRHPISRAVHLGRLASFYPVCRECVYRGDTGTLSPRQVEQLQEVQSSGGPRSLFHNEGAGGVYMNDLTPVAARRIATAFAIVMRNTKGDSSLVADGKTGAVGSIVLAGDGRPITAEVTAAVAEGIRWSGCDMIDIGPATAACLAFAVDHLNAAGGILVGNPGDEPHIVDLQFWAARARPLSLGGSLEPIMAQYPSGVDSPAYGYGTLGRAAADVPYLAALAEHYHALRPLRVVVDSASRPLVEYLAKLTASVACEVIPCRVAPRELPEQIRADAAHFGVCVDGNGETCRWFDEQGCAISAERLLLLLADGRWQGKASSVSVVLEDGISLPVIRQLEQRGMAVVMSIARRADMATAMRDHGSDLGGGLSGRFWFAVAGVRVPDALMAITRLLVILSRSDAPLSAVLDREAPLG